MGGNLRNLAGNRKFNMKNFDEHSNIDLIYKKQSKDEDFKKLVQKRNNTILKDVFN